jgi:hypothetical protein
MLVLPHFIVSVPLGAQLRLRHLGNGAVTADSRHPGVILFIYGRLHHIGQRSITSCFVQMMLIFSQR